MDFGDNSICEECAMICMDIYSDEEHEDMVVYGNQGITTEKYDEDMYGDLMDKSLSIIWPYWLMTV